jgi:zinc-ribbon domain
MSLTHCTECGQEVSDHATVCPHCGNPLHAVAAPPPPVQPPVVTVKKNSHPVLTIVGGLTIVVVILFVILAVVGSSKASAKFVATDILSDENCTQLTDYCINVYCTFQNQGNAAGANRVRAQLIDKASGEVRAEHYTDLTLLPNASQRVTFSFPEAELGWEVRSVCKADAPSGQ